jgi:SagB-type dehydrogenase family enzyme
MSVDVKIEQQLRICLGASDATLSTMTWREYHESTQHSVESLKQALHVLDWANMPDSFRHYEGVPVLDLPADPPSPEIPALEVLHGVSGATPAGDGPTFLSQLLFYSAAISASKRVPSTGYRYALRVNPSSGNLHPTEFHFVTRGLKEWPDGLYHYRPFAHMAEQRALGGLEMTLADSSAPIVFVLTSIVWREAWKYRDRAYRYCLHDMGHAWQALALAARAIGCDSFAVGDFPDDAVAQFCRLYEDEWPMLIVELRGRSIPVREPDACATVGTAGKQINSRKKEPPRRALTGFMAARNLASAGAAASPPPIRLPLAAARSSCLLQLHRRGSLVRSPACGVRHSAFLVEFNRCR